MCTANLDKTVVIKGFPGTILRVPTAFPLMILAFGDVMLCKGTVVPVHAMKAYKGSSGMTLQYLTSALDLGKLSASRQGPFKVPNRSNPDTQ
jgi:hypothetical protein